MGNNRKVREKRQKHHQERIEHFKQLQEEIERSIDPNTCEGQARICLNTESINGSINNPALDNVNLNNVIDPEYDILDKNEIIQTQPTTRRFRIPFFSSLIGFFY